MLQENISPVSAWDMPAQCGHIFFRAHDLHSVVFSHFKDVTVCKRAVPLQISANESVLIFPKGIFSETQGYTVLSGDRHIDVTPAHTYILNL